MNKQGLCVSGLTAGGVAICLAIAGCSNSPPATGPVVPAPQVSKPASSAAEVAAKPKSPLAKVAPQGKLPDTGERTLFQNWPQPKFVFVLTGQQLGYIEPCGCTGLANQKGGLARRATFIAELRDQRKWPVVPLDVGSQVQRFGKQAEIKFRTTAQGLRSMGYRAVALGADDLKLGGELIAGTNPDEKPSIFTSANAAVLDRSLTPRFQILEVAGKKIGVVAVLGEIEEKRLQGDEVIHAPALDSLQKAMAELQEKKCDLYVLLAHASMDETKKLAQEVPQFDLVVTSGGAGEPNYELEKIEGTKSLLAQVGTKGMYAGVVGVFEKAPLRYQRVALDSHYADAADMIALLANYQKELEKTGLAELGAKELPHPSGRTFVGTAKCGECHAKALAIWEKTPHAHATDSLQKPPHEAENARSKIPRQFDPECLSCHVTGWDAQKFYPYSSGYLSLDKTPHLAQNGCENCHGPGSAHVAAESGETKPGNEELAKLRGEMKLPLGGGVAEKHCMQCHDLDNSPDFHVKGAFEKYWKKVEHQGKD